MFTFFRGSMIARMVALGAVCILTAGAEKGCVFGASSGDDDPIDNVDDGSGNGETFSTTLVLRDSGGTQTTTFEPDELITFELTVRNLTATAQTVDLSTNRASDFYVFEDGEEQALWFATQGLQLPAVVTPLEFAANETKTMTFTWNQELLDGTFLPSGDYDARGLVAAVGVSADPDDPDELRSTLRGFRID